MSRVLTVWADCEVVDLNLNDRKIRILEAIITDYIETAEPIGSRTIAKKYDMGISSATIRNEMSDLEDMGLIVQPHASSGRVPSDKGYRLYVNSLIPKRKVSDEDATHLRKLVASHINQVDFMMREIASSIALLTNYTTIVSEPLLQRTLIRHVQLLPMDEQSVVVVVVTDSGAVKSQVVDIGDTLQISPKYEELVRVSEVLSKKLAGLGAGDVCQSLFEVALEAEFISLVLPAIVSVLANEDERRVYTGGVKNMLSFPEFSDIEKARKLFHALDEREMLITLLDTQDFGDDIQVIIGSENSVAEMKDCSIIKANYRLGRGGYGAIGIIGPTRMDYVQTMAVLAVIVNNINTALASMHRRE